MPTNNIELRSEEVQEIIGIVPHWLLRSGITVVFIIVSVLFAGSFFFKYPDVVTAKATLSGNTPPANIKARLNGKITQLFVEDKQQVRKDEVLAIIENTCNYAHYKVVYSLMDSLNQSIETTEIEKLPCAENHSLQLGELQNYYSGFLKQLKSYKNFVQIDYQRRKINGLNLQIAEYTRYTENLQNLVNLSQKDLKLQEKQFRRDSLLHLSGVISAEEYEKSASQFLQKKGSFQNSENAISNSKIQISNLEQSVLDLELQYQQQKETQIITLKESIEAFLAQAHLWEQNYLLKSPFAGKIVFSKIWTNFQNLNAGDVVFTIIAAEEKREITARANLPLSGAGKVKKGQKVNLKLNDYPFQEFGILQGSVQEISAVNDGENYTVLIHVKQSLQTNYKLKIPFKQNMQASAEIITEDLPLAARFFNPIKSLFLN